ncbi:hypothetical protein LTR17_023753 [Elasticomyces elasticus]|nr:hypothetical protein LTR17_023753 [Elasticomyces elasticus]
MYPSAILASICLAFAGGAHAWAQAGNGVWVANNVKYSNLAGHSVVHEACTKMNTNEVYDDCRPCAYWKDGNGNVFNGYCQSPYRSPYTVDCVSTVIC